MTFEMNPEEAARCLRRLGYLKLDFNTFIVLSKKPQDEASKQHYLEIYGDSVYLPAPESMLAELSGISSFLKYRNIRKEETKGENDTSFNKRIASDFVKGLWDSLGLKTETDDKMNVYISKNQLLKIKTHDSFDVKELYSHITRAGMTNARKGSSTQWG